MVKTITVRPSARESLIEPNFRQDDALGRRIMEDFASLVRSAE